MVNIYGIPNCDSTKKAFAWLSQNKVKFEFHDYKKEGITKEKITTWLQTQPLEILLNKKGTTWKGLTGVAQKKANNEQEAIKLMVENTSLIKRPVIEFEENILVGFDTALYKNILLK
jgi:arsenate reductase (glutaredoxin)